MYFDSVFTTSGQEDIRKQKALLCICTEGRMYRGTTLLLTRPICIPNLRPGIIHAHVLSAGNGANRADL